MSVLETLFLGIIQGITEFLPISSSGHLVLLPWLFGWEDPGLSFSVSLHLGTLIAVLVYFWKDWRSIILVGGTKLFGLRKKKEAGLNDARLITYSSAMLWLIILATVPGVLAGYFLNDLAETTFRNPLLISASLLIFGLLLYLGDKYYKQERKIENITWKDSILIGLAQAVAIIPGTSRSGITITMARVLGINRADAARFSFLLATPIILGAAIYRLSDPLNIQIGLAEILGILVAAISGYWAIAWLIKFVEKADYKIFFWYRLILAVLIILFYLFG